MGFELTNNDTIWMALGTATEAVVSWSLNKTATPPDSSAQYPSLASAAFVAGPAVAIAYSGMNDPDADVNRKLAAFLFGFGTSGVVSYLIPKLVGGGSDTTSSVAKKIATSALKQV